MYAVSEGNEPRWSMPVYVLADDGSEIPLLGPSDALRYLHSHEDMMAEFPIVADACERCADRKLDSAISRALFVKAYTRHALLRW